MNSIVTPQGCGIDSHPNPYDPPPSVSGSNKRQLLSRFFALKSEPAIVVAAGVLLGAMSGVPLLIAEHSVGYFTMLPGAILGGMAYRMWSASNPIDRTTRVRLWLYVGFAIMTITAVAAAIYLPSVAAQMRRVLGRGIGMAMGLAFISGTFAVGMAFSGDHRASKG